MSSKGAKCVCGVLLVLGLTCVFDRAFAQVGYLEGDVWPFTANIQGDGRVTFLDWQTIAFFYLGLDRTPTDPIQFAAADCAPRETLGDGSITTIDVIQAYRYSVGLEPWTFLGGPTNAVAKQPLLGGPRTISIASTNLVRGKEHTLQVRLNGDGTEFAVGFSLDFDPTQLCLVSPTNMYPDPQDPPVEAVVNPFNATNGHLSAFIMSSSWTGLSSNLLAITFRAIGSNITTIHFSDNPSLREISDTNAIALPATYVDATIGFIYAPQFTNFSLANGSFHYSVSGTNGQSFRIENSTNLQDWQTVATITLTNDTQAFQDAASDVNRFYRAVTVP